MTIDMTISAGQIVQTVILVIGFVWAGARLYGEFREMRLKLHTLWRMIVGDPSIPGPEGKGLDGRIEHAVRGAVADVLLKQRLVERGP